MYSFHLGATALYDVRSLAPISLSQLNCTGDEERLYDCPHPGAGNHSCTPGMVAGLFCGGKTGPAIGTCKLFT